MSAALSTLRPLRLLVVLPTSPLPVFSGGRQRMVEVLRRLAVRHEVTVLSYWRDEEAREGLQRLAKDMPVDVVPVPFARLRPGRRLPRQLWRRWQGKRQGLPADVPVWDQPAMHEAVSRVLASRPIDLVQVEWPYLSTYALAHPETPSILITHDIFSVGLQRRAPLVAGLGQRQRLQKQADAWTRYESRVYPRFGAVAAMSATDAAIIRQRAPAAKVVVLPNGVDTTALTPGEIRPQVQRLLYVGSPTHAPNLDAACWLLMDIWPALHRRHPELRLTLVNLDHPQVRACAPPHVEITGRIPDLVPLYRQTDLVLVPLRAGSGTRLKILEAFALGVPVISTPIGYEGLDVSCGEHLLAAETSSEFVDAVERLMADIDLRRGLASTARALAVARYDWSTIVALHEEAYQKVLTP